jgi:hypothetical protein
MCCRLSNLIAIVSRVCTALSDSVYAYMHAYKLITLEAVGAVTKEDVGETAVVEKTEVHTTITVGNR